MQEMYDANANVQYVKFVPKMYCTIPKYVISIVHRTNELYIFRDSIDIAQKNSFYSSPTAGEMA